MCGQWDQIHKARRFDSAIERRAVLTVVLLSLLRLATQTLILTSTLKFDFGSLSFLRQHHLNDALLRISLGFCLACV
jgi:hypothetical protein